VPSATAILDRFLHHAEVLAFQGKSYRLRNPPPAAPPTDTADDSSNTAIPPAGSKRKKGGSTPPSDKPGACQE
jgi:hypothetical protein